MRLPIGAEGEVVTVIMDSGARITGRYRPVRDGYAEVNIDGWRVDATKIMAWQLGDHPWRRPTKRKADADG